MKRFPFTSPEFGFIVLVMVLPLVVAFVWRSATLWALAVFFTLLNAIQRRFSKTAIIKLKGIFETSEWLNVHLDGSKTLERVRFVGFTNDRRNSCGSLNQPHLGIMNHSRSMRFGP